MNDDKTCPACGEPYDKPAVKRGAPYQGGMRARLQGLRPGKKYLACPNCDHVCGMNCGHPREIRIRE